MEPMGRPKPKSLKRPKVHHLLVGGVHLPITVLVKTAPAGELTLLRGSGDIVYKVHRIP